MGTDVELRDGELLLKEKCNREYLMELDSAALLQNYYQEAGLNQNFGGKFMAHGGWEDPTCQLRGHFLGHWLSAAAVRYAEYGDEELLAKANAIVHELRICQKENGGQWAAAIPEKYFQWIARGKEVWAPHYNVHKTFTGLNDMYRYAGNKEALEIAVDFAKWFFEYTNDKSREQMDNILDFETGGMLEVWADLYEFTGDEMFLTLIDRYDRKRLFDPLLEGRDVLTNMHANTTIPEAIGAARVYEVTGNERFRDIALAYWKCAVTDRSTWVTGGQTCGEIWTPMNSMSERLGDKNQEHCTVYNMIRLADILFKWTGEPAFLDYIERNIYNGIMAQGYFRGGHTNGQLQEYPEEGLITYFLPMRPGSRKGWGHKTQDFFCCHGTLVQANSAHNRYLWYQDGSDIYVGIYAGSKANFDLSGQKVEIVQYRDNLSGNIQAGSNNVVSQGINELTSMYAHQPDRMVECFTVHAASKAEFTLNLRIPEWVKTCPRIYVNGEDFAFDRSGFSADRRLTDAGLFIPVKREWSDGDEIKIVLPLSLYTVKLEGTDDMYAFSYGPLALAGLTDCERILYTDGKQPEELLVHDNEREWGSWKETFRTRYQDPGIRFVPLNQIGYEKYQVYFQVV